MLIGGKGVGKTTLKNQLYIAYGSDKNKFVTPVRPTAGVEITTLYNTPESTEYDYKIWESKYILCLIIKLQTHYMDYAQCARNVSHAAYIEIK